MTERKQTPDILGEILSGTAPAETPAQPIAKPAAPPKPIEVPRRSISKKESVPGSHWEYLVVSFQDRRGWRARFVNGEEFDDWESGSLIHELLDQLGDDGWELISVNRGDRLYGRTDQIQTYFKRVKR